MTATTAISTEHLDLLFPFHLWFDTEGRLLETGPSLRRLLGGAVATELDQAVEVRRPRRFDPAKLGADDNVVAQLRMVAQPVDLRGQILSLDKGATFHFLGSPWVADTQKMRELGLEPGDFAYHDQTPNQVLLNGTVQQALDQARQLTAELEAKSAELVRERTLLRRILSEIPAGIYWRNSDGRFGGCNRLFAREVGLNDPADIVGRSDDELSARGRKATIDGIDAEVIKDGKRRLNIAREAKSRDGSPMHLSLSKVPLRDEDRNVIGMIGLITDVTDRHVMEEQLARASRLESIGQLAAGVAHEINTPTQFIGDNLRFLSDSFGDLIRVVKALGQQLADRDPDGELGRLLAEADVDFLEEEIPSAIDQSLGGVTRVREIVDSMKEFAHPGTGRFETVDLNHAVATAATMARNEWRYVAELRTDLDPELPLVPCLPGEIGQVLVNMIVNAAHAIAETGSIDRAGRIEITTGTVDQHVEIRIADNGGGVPPEVRDKIFDPFFTTKEVGKGTGQGLSLSHSIVVNKHGGAIEVESEMGRGTTFVIRLPLVAATAS
jgi:PAS domain S-box-containing protein